jgi:hypothetical protein
MSASAPLLFLALGATAAPTAPKFHTPKDNAVFCGGQTDVATVERYFSDLRQALAKPGSKARFNMFANEEFGIRDKRGRTLYFKVSDIGSVSPAYIKLREWKEISRRGARGLENAGWRGCFMDLGKVWFEGSKEDGFRLTLIARDMPWRKPEKGDALP